MNNLTDLPLQSNASFKDQEVKAAFEDVVFCDRSHWGLIKLTGAERSRFLHNQSTNNINILKPGQGCDTVFVNSTGRTLDLVTVYVREDEILLLVSPQRREFLMQWLDRFIFPFDKVNLSDVSDSFAIFTLIGPESGTVLHKLGFDSVINLPENSHITVNFDSTDLLITVGNGLKIPGYNLILPIDKSADLCSKITELWNGHLACSVWENLRILQGRPAVNCELTEDYNPLEAGLWDCISFNKGCYIGQETIARLNTYKGVKTRLWGIKLTDSVIPGETITLNGEKVGILTSFTTTEKGHFGLGYVKTKAGGEGLQIKVGNITGEIVPVPFLKHEYYEPEK